MTELEQISSRIPPGLQWHTGSGTKRSFAQIIPPYRRNFSWFAIAETEEKALAKAVAEFEADRARRC